jgi:hypothetical protein
MSTQHNDDMDIKDDHDEQTNNPYPSFFVYVLFRENSETLLKHYWRRRFLFEPTTSNLQLDIVQWLRSKCRVVHIQLNNENIHIFMLDMKRYRVRNPTYDRLEKTTDENYRKKNILRPFVPHIPTKEVRYWSDLKRTDDGVDVTENTFEDLVRLHPEWPYYSALYVLMVDHATLIPKEYKHLSQPVIRTSSINSAHAVLQGMDDDNDEVESKSYADTETSSSSFSISNSVYSMNGNTASQVKSRNKVVGTNFIGANMMKSGEFDAFKQYKKFLQNNERWIICNNQDVNELPKSAYEVINDYIYVSEQYDFYIDQLINKSSLCYMNRHQKCDAVCSVWDKNPTDLQQQVSSAPHCIGTGFFIHPCYLVTCFHCVYKVTEVQKEPEMKHPFKANANKFYYKLYNGVIGDFNVNNIVFPEDHATRCNIGFDLVIIQVPEVSKLDSYIQFIPTNNAYDQSKFDLSITASSFLVRFADTDRLNRTYAQRMFIIGAEPDNQGTIVITDTNNDVLGYSNWEVHYACRTIPGYSGAPGLFSNGQLACIHRRAGMANDIAGYGKSYFNVGLRIDLFLRDALNIYINRAPPPPQKQRLGRKTTEMITILKTYYASAGV